MSLPQVETGVAATETALIARIAAVAAAAGWTTWTAGTTPAGAVYMRSSGEDRTSHIVGGFASTTLGRMQAITGADVDTLAIVSANTAVYTNNDAAGVANRVQAITPDSASNWVTRTASSYTYALAAGRDFIAVVCSYSAGGAAAQGVLYLGKVEPCMGRYEETYAKAFIASVGAGSIGTQRLITLDRNITYFMKDLASWPGDVATSVTMFFQAIATSGADTPDFAMVQRIPIVSGTLATVGGVTQFEINVAGVKQAAAARRYASNRGAGDVVRMMTEPTIAVAGAASGGTAPWTFGSLSALSAWDGFGGQRASLWVWLANAYGAEEGSSDPVRSNALLVPFRIYITHRVNETGLITQANNEGLKCTGVLPGLYIFSNNANPNFSLLQIDAQATQRYRIISQAAGIGLGVPQDWTAGTFGVGPGW